MAAVHQRLSFPVAPSHPRRGSHGPRRGDIPPQVCRYWKSGHCSRNPCRFLHADVPPPPPPRTAKKPNNTWVNPSCVDKPKPPPDAVPPPPPSAKRPQNDAPPTLPPTRLSGGEDVAGWCVGDGGFRGVAQLKGHAKAVTGRPVPRGRAGGATPMGP